MKKQPSVLGTLAAPIFVGSTVCIARGPQEVVGKVGTVRFLCDDGNSCLVEVPGHREPTFGEWPIPASALEVQANPAEAPAPQAGQGVAE
jgi:hypothetical protein